MSNTVRNDTTSFSSRSFGEAQPGRGARRGLAVSLGLCFAIASTLAAGAAPNGPERAPSISENAAAELIAPLVVTR